MKIEHIAIYVKDIEKTKKFYEKYFGAISNDLYHNEGNKFKSYFLTFDSGARLEIMTIDGLTEQIKEAKRTGFIHLAFSVGSREKVEEVTNEIRLAGYEIVSEPRMTGDGYYESCVADPEGNFIEITI